MEVVKKDIEAVCRGMSLFDAKKYVMDKYPSVHVEIVYERGEAPDIVNECHYNVRGNTITLYSGTNTFVGTLPTVYQGNEFLENFAMVFQHLMNSVNLTLDNIDVFFSPTKTPKYYIPILASWFNVDLSVLGSDERVIRKVIQYTIPLYKLRGTSRGLKALLYLVTGVMPEVIEGKIPFDELAISNDAGIESPMFGNLKKEFVFYVYFPVLEADFTVDMVNRIHTIVQREKPAYMKAYVCFKPPKVRDRKITVFEPGMETMGEEGIYF